MMAVAIATRALRFPESVNAADDKPYRDVFRTISNAFGPGEPVAASVAVAKAIHAPAGTSVLTRNKGSR
jgi:hypothetical protein